MFSKASLIAFCAAVAVKEVAAGHGHQYAHADKREIVWAATETVVVTDYVTVTVTEGQEPTAAAATTTTSSQAHKPHHHSHSKQSTTTPVTTAVTTTPVVIAESSTSVAVPTVIPTTMITAVKPTTTKATTQITTVPTTTKATTVVKPTTTTPVVLPTTTSPAATSTPVVVHGGSKRGLAYNDASLVQEFLTLGGKASWAYNWGAYTGDLPAGVTYYPMLWSPAPEHSNGWDGAAKAAIAKGADALLSFNEPDIASQANMSPQDAAAGHIKFMNPYAGQARISTPAISSSENANQGIDWLKQFFNACNGQCKFDFCAAHWYGPGGVNGANLFLQHLKAVNTACDGKPVWVTEFAAESDSVDEFVSTIVQALESDEYGFVEKYSYFMANVGNLFTSSTQLSSYGKIYAGI
ncbi:glycosyl hydrolase catalytic core-domain-containing protein [Nemania sp. NC0429]|nr:glycosyl hydrolase catalytic core-domain-containing protein [Nemania sp. NC0429]